MADLEGETQLDRVDRPHNEAVDSPVAMDSLLATLRGLEVELRQQDISETSSSNYCNNFCQALMQFAGRRNSIEHGLPLLEVYCLSITCFVSARPHLTTESDKVALVLKRLALSCFELLLSVPENAIPYEAWMQFHRSVQAAHDTLQQYGNTDLQALLRILGEGGAWSNPALIALLTGQPTNPDEVGALLQLEGDSFMEMRVKHLLKMGEVTQAMLLAKTCADSAHMASRTSFRQIYVTHLCDMLPSEGAIMEISRVDGREVLEIICNLETEGQENLALILCTTFLTQQLQQGNIYCSWELTLFWSKLQRRVEASLDSFLGQCLQLGAIARTVYHLLFLVRVVQSEAEQLGLAASVELCVRALQLPRHEDADTKTSVCKTLACLLPDDLEVRRACQLTEFLLCTSPVAYTALEELYLRPDQKHEESSPLVPNSLRCELLLALKAHWPFDPEFWDWKTLKRHCLRLLGPEAKGEEERPEGGGQEERPEGGGQEERPEGGGQEERPEGGGQEERPEGGGRQRAVAGDAAHQSQEEVKGKEQRVTGDMVRNEEPVGSGKDLGESEVKKYSEVETTEALGSQKAPPVKKAPSERSLRWQKYKFFCLICQREVIEARLLHHSRKHVEDGVFTCPVCLQKFPARQDFVMHTSKHIQMPARRSLPQKRKKVKKKVNLQREMEEDEELDSSLEPGEIALDPSLLMYYQSTQDPDILEHLLEQAAAVPKRPADDDYITFEYIAAHFQLQEREVYPCPATGCAKTFKQFKYLSVHLKAEHDGSGDENVRHYLEMKDRREKCTFCRRHFMTAYHHRRHRRAHYGDRPYTCVVTGCGARFDTTNELLAHKQSHGFQLSYRCELKGCSLTFCDLGLLYHHEAQHFRDAAYSCTHPGCKKFYFSKRDFLKHLATHGITFTEEDFAAQREKKRNPTECLAEGLTVQEALPGDESRNGTDVKCCSLTNATPTSSSTIREPRGTLTCVAVCFDGRKFTCGFESCRRTFTQASEVQKHLKCVHPGQIKSERKEKKGQKKLSKSKGDVRESAQAPPGCLLAQGTGQERSCSSAAVPHKPAPALSPLTDDFLKDVLLGLSRLNLSSCSPRSSQSDPCHSISGSSVSQVSCPPTSSASASPSATKVSRKKNAPKPQPAVEKQPPPRAASSSPSERPSQTAQQQSDFLIQPSTKPYRCEVKGCKFKSVTCHALKGHYLRRHGFSQERLRGIDVFKTSNFKPFKCHLCPKGYRQKTELRIHYMQMHKFTETLVEQMHCSSKRREEGKAPEPRKPKVSTRRGPQLQKKPAKKLPKVVKANNTCEQRGVKMEKEERKKCVRVWTPERENGLVKPYNMSNKTDVKAAKTPSSDLPASQAEAEMERASREGRGSRRLVAKGNLCYILTKYHKPFHCVHKDCSSAFTHQSSLVRHLQAVHRYNRAQLCLEEDLELRHGAGVRKADTAASKLQRLHCKHKGCGKNFPNNSSLWRHYRRQHGENTEDGHEPSSPRTPPRAPESQPGTPPSSEEPIPRFKCSYGDCTASYHLYSSLLRHTSHVHRSPLPQGVLPPPEPQQVRCRFEGCTRVFTQNSSYMKHVFYRHCDYYDSVVLRLQNAHKRDKSASGCQKKLIVSATPKQKQPSPLQKGTPKLPLRHSQRQRNQEGMEEEEEEEGMGENTEEDGPKSPRPRRTDQKDLQFRSHEEALQMCQDRCLPVAYPCMVQDCDSVLTVESSMRRHYLNCHRMRVGLFNAKQDELVNNAEQLEELIQRKSALSARPCPDPARVPNGVLKVEYQAEPENMGGLSLPMSLHSIKADPLDGQEQLVFGGQELDVVINALPPAEVLENDPEGNQAPQQEISEEQPAQLAQSPLPPKSSCLPPPVDLSPPATLRFTSEETTRDSVNKDSECSASKGNGSASPAFRPVKGKNELPEAQPPPRTPSRLPVPKDISPPTPMRPFDLTAYKPMGFESSFLKFIQESKSKEEQLEEGVARGSCPKPNNQQKRHQAITEPLATPVRRRSRDSHRRARAVKENSQRGATAAVTRSRQPRLSSLKRLLCAREFASVQNLRSILDRALTGCGDLAIKQLQYLRPVVVLERSKFSTSSLLDLFPSKKPEKLLRASS